MNKGSIRRSHQQKKQQETRIERKKWVVKPNYNDEENQSLPTQQQLNIDVTTKTIPEFVRLPSPESVRKHPMNPKSNGFDPYLQPHVIEKTAASDVCLLSVSNYEKQEEDRKSEKSKDEVDLNRSRLEEILLVAQEPKFLSEEQLRVNDRLQEEEILAMEAIYGENFIVLDRQDGLRSFQINIHIDVPNELVIYSTKVGSCDGEVEFGGIGSEAMATAVNSNEFLYSFKVQFLPPIVLTCLLSKTYPSHSAPYFTISVQWLDAMRISSLCQMLDTIWTDQSGKEIVYPWLDWLQSSSLSHLEFDNRIPLVASFGKADNAGDIRAISESVSPDVDIRFILNYNDDKLNEEFCQNLHECCICLSDHPGTRFVKLPCRHCFCRNCMLTYSTMQAKEGGAIVCPQIKCSELVPPGLVKSLLGDEKFEQWESLFFQKTLDTMSDIVYCPRCDMACVEDEDHLAQCTECFFTFCGRCRDKLHVGVECETLEEKIEFLQLTQPTQNGEPVLTKQQLKELDKINVRLNEREIKRISKRCPKCATAITRSYGCNHMHCSNCKQDFCFKCGKKYEQGKRLCCGYFDFDEETIRQQRQERREDQLRQVRQREAQRQQQREARRQDPVARSREQRRVQNQSRIEDPANHPHPCPICSQMNAKVANNNHIFCWSCQQHYCYLCRGIVKRSSQHYGPKGCKQHSVG
ncbi:hypothetical protein MKW92_022218 [Papaver armeniacum]|nr:hypothetical protein MKW92_022218 [Papaver armeniacum]